MTQTPDPAQSVAGSILGTKWKPRLIVALATEGRLGFGNLERELEGISSKVLSTNLEDLRDHGVVTRDVVQEQPRRVEYELTVAGRELYAILESMAQWDGTYAAGAGVPTVLLAEDDHRLLELYSLWLTADYDVIVASDGRDALSLFDDSVDVVILDRYLPEMDGDVIAKSITSAGKRTPTAMLTSMRVTPADVSLPVDLLIRKPITKADLLETIEELCGLTGEGAVARDVRARRQKLAFVETHLGSSVRSTAPYRDARAELSRIETDRSEAIEDREPWRQLLGAESTDSESEAAGSGDETDESADST